MKFTEGENYELDAKELASTACFPISNKNQLSSKLSKFLSENLKGIDLRIARLDSFAVNLRPSYLVDYSINSDFRTTVGLIHSVHETSTTIVDEDGKMVDGHVNYALQTQLDSLVFLADVNSTVSFYDKGVFVRSNTEIRDIVRQALVQHFTKTVGYYGGNNRHYYKTCIPKSKDLQISRVRKVFIPFLTISFSLSRSNYVFIAVESADKLTAIRYEKPSIQVPGANAFPSVCMTCSNSFSGDGKYVCNNCGKISCANDTFRCKQCGRQICRQHTVFKRRYLILVDKFCGDCFHKTFGS